jgi:Fe-S-cluster containining protein
MLRKFKCVDNCSDCCIYREYYPSVQYGKTGVLILPEEKYKIEKYARKMNLRIRILPRIGIGTNRQRSGPRRILIYQLMGGNSDGNLCPFLDIHGKQRSPHGGFSCRIYEHRPLACRAFPVIEVTEGGLASLDNKCQFCVQKSSVYAKDAHLNAEIEALDQIKNRTKVDEKGKVWRYATNTGDIWNRSELFPEGWIPEDI